MKKLSELIPTEIQVTESITTETGEQFYFELPRENQLEALEKLLGVMKPGDTLYFPDSREHEGGECFLVIDVEENNFVAFHGGHGHSDNKTTLTTVEILEKLAKLIPGEVRKLSSEYPSIFLSTRN